MMDDAPGVNVVEVGKDPAHFRYVDSLRGLAILGVISTHISAFTKGLPGPLQSFLSSGHYGVQLFFMMSAFTLFNSIHSRPHSSYWVRDFYIRRFFRIAPLFYVGILIYAFWRAYQFGRFPTTLETVLSLTFLNSLSVPYINSLVPGQWSVSVEMLFYLTVPWLSMRIRSASSAGIFVGISWLVSILAHFATRRIHVEGQFFELWFPKQLPVFAAGFALYFVSNSLYQDPKHIPLLKWSLAIGASASVLLLSSGDRIPGTQTWVTLALFLFALGLGRIQTALVVNSFTRLVGTVSFSMYVLHFILLDLASDHILTIIPSKSPWIHLITLSLIVIPSTIGLSLITHRFIEMPGQKLAKRIIGLMSGSKPAAA